MGWDALFNFWVSRGFALVTPNLRGSTGFGKAYEMGDNVRKRLDVVMDLIEINRWVREQPWADGKRIALGGQGYGAYLTFLALEQQPGKWRTGFGLNGIVNLQTWLLMMAEPMQSLMRSEFGPVEDDISFYFGLSPINNSKRLIMPLFVFQGKNNQRIPRSESDQLVAALRKNGSTVEYMVAPDEGDSIIHHHNRGALASRLTRFLEQYLLLPGPPEGCKVLIDLDAPEPQEQLPAAPTAGNKAASAPAKAKDATKKEPAPGPVKTKDATKKEPAPGPVKAKDATKKEPAPGPAKAKQPKNMEPDESWGVPKVSE
jgi:dienelactone hydrolase